jgi:hypothetical protein
MPKRSTAMSQTQQRLTKGTYAYCSHSLLLSGDVVEVFVGRWIVQATEDGETRVLQKFPPEAEIKDGFLLCVLKLRRPITLGDYREVHHPSLRPMVQSLEDDVQMVLVRAEMLCTIPDGM